MADLLVYYPSSFGNEARFIIDYIFQNRLGLSCVSAPHNEGGWKIGCTKNDSTIVLESRVREWKPTIALSAKDQVSIAGREELKQMGLVFGGETPLPGVGSVLEIKGENEFCVPIPFLSAIFVIITGYLEDVSSDYDLHDRHAASNFDWLGEGFHEIPIVDRYVEILRFCLKRAFPFLKFQKTVFRVSPSHDVDWPFLYRAMPPKVMLRRCLGDITKRKKPWQIPKTILDWRSSRRGNPGRDPFFTFDWIMRQSEERGLVSTFYFITDHSHPTMDGTYSFDDPCIHGLLNEIHDRGHQIGLHASYNSYLDGAQIKREFEILRTRCDSLGITQAEWGSRQHFLRWRTSETARHLDEAGVDFDSTLGIAATGGFRNGTCHEFPMFDHGRGAPLKIREKPLVAMECSFIDDRYRGLGAGEEAVEAMNRLKNECRAVGGDFQILWHNDRFSRFDEEGIYQDILDRS